MKSTHLIVSGTVQGVFFRSNTRNKAMGLGITGFTRNLPDGNVEIVAQGEEDKIKELIEFIKRGPGISKVSNVQIKHEEIEKFKKFDIRY